MYYKITPVPKPRMTRRDKWLSPPRPAVARYRAFCDEVRAIGVELPEKGARVTFYMPMPKSWSKRRQDQMVGMPHQNERADWDNLGKALSDAVYGHDGHIWDIRITKRWAREGGIIIE